MIIRSGIAFMHGRRDDKIDQRVCQVSMSIPHEIHQIWLQGADHLPEKHRAGRDAWRRMHPGWRHTLWDDGSIRALLSEHYPWFLPTYRGYRHLHQRADSGRYFILYRIAV